MRTMHLAAHHKMGKGKGKMGKGKGRQPRLSTHSMRSSPVPRTGACTTVQRLLMKGTRSWSMHHSTQYFPGLLGLYFDLILIIDRMLLSPGRPKQAANIVDRTVSKNKLEVRGREREA